MDIIITLLNTRNATFAMIVDIIREIEACWKNKKSSFKCVNYPETDVKGEKKALSLQCMSALVIICLTS